MKRIEMINYLNETSKKEIIECMPIFLISEKIDYDLIEILFDGKTSVVYNIKCEDEDLEVCFIKRGIEYNLEQMR